MTELIPYDFYNPYPRIENLAVMSYNEARSLSRCSDRLRKNHRGVPGYDDVSYLDELVKMKNAARNMVDYGLELVDMTSAEIMRLSL